ncbi:hypothetical protein HpMS197_00790 [Helicobacter pylori]
MEKTCHNIILESNDCIFMFLGYLRARKDSEGFAIDKYLKRAETMIKLEDGTCILDDEFSKKRGFIHQKRISKIN